jgi:hypothetical protein
MFLFTKLGFAFYKDSKPFRGHKSENYCLSFFSGIWESEGCLDVTVTDTGKGVGMRPN